MTKSIEDAKSEWVSCQLKYLGVSPASLILEAVVNHLKCFLAPGIAQDSSSGEKNGSIILEFYRDGVKLPNTLSFLNEIEHLIKQVLKYSYLLILLYCLKNPCLQLSPGLLHTRAGSWLGSWGSGWLALHAELLIHSHWRLLLSLSNRLRVGRRYHWLIEQLIKEFVRLLATRLSILLLLLYRWLNR